MEETQDKNNYNSESFEDIIDFQEYYLLKDYTINKIIIGKNKNEIFIKCKNYIISFNQIELSTLINIQINSLDDAFKFIINIFEDNNVNISKIIKNEEIKLIMKNNNDKNIEITLIYNKYNNDNYNPIINEINKLKNEINILKKYHEINNPKDIQLLSNIVNDSYGFSDLDNSFTVFKTINDILYLIYTTKNKSIICYDLNEQKKIKELEYSHNEYITNFKHYLDEINKRDLIMSISHKDNNIKIWNVNNWECIQNFTSVNKDGYLLSACFLEENNQIYIITSNWNKNGNSENIKIFDLNGQKIKEINNSNEKTFFIDIYYDNLLSKKYIITGNLGYNKSYNYNDNQLYHKYNDKDTWSHNSIIIKNIKNKIKLIESSCDGNIRIWNFHSGLLLNKIKISDNYLNGICLWNDNYLFVGCSDKSIKLVELKNGLLIKSSTTHTDKVITVKKIIHPKYGECLISQNLGKSEIKLWITKNN